MELVGAGGVALVVITVTFAVFCKKNMKIKKNDKRRVIVICKQKGCPFYLRVSKSMQALIGR